MYNLSPITNPPNSVNQKQEVNFKSSNKITKVNDKNLNFKSNPMTIDSYDSFISKQKKEKRKQNFLTWLQASALVAIIVTAFYAVKGYNGKQFEKSKEELKEIWSNLDSSAKIKDLALPDSLNNFINKFKNSVENTDILQKRGGKASKSVLLYGPPGTGKTTFAKALAKEFPDSKFASLDVTSLGSEYQSVSERNLNKAVDLICKEADSNPTKRFFVFIDEIDSVMMVDNSLGAKHSNDMLNEFKKCFTEKLGKRNNIITIGATNLPIDIEKGIAIGGKKLDRPMLDRFSEKILVDLPTKDQITNSINYHYKNSELVSEKLKTKSDELDKIAEFLSNKDRNTSFRTLESLYDSTASSITDKTRNVEIEDLLKTIYSKQNELNFSNSDFTKLLKDLNIKPTAI